MSTIHYIKITPITLHYIITVEQLALLNVFSLKGKIVRKYWNNACQIIFYIYSENFNFWNKFRIHEVKNKCNLKSNFNQFSWML